MSCYQNRPSVARRFFVERAMTYHELWLTSACKPCVTARESPTSQMIQVGEKKLDGAHFPSCY